MHSSSDNSRISCCAGDDPCQHKIKQTATRCLSKACHHSNLSTTLVGGHQLATTTAVIGAAAAAAAALLSTQLLWLHCIISAGAGPQDQHLHATNCKQHPWPLQSLEPNVSTHPAGYTASSAGFGLLPRPAPPATAGSPSSSLLAAWHCSIANSRGPLGLEGHVGGTGVQAGPAAAAPAAAAQPPCSSPGLLRYSNHTPASLAGTQTEQAGVGTLIRVVCVHRWL